MKKCLKIFLIGVLALTASAALAEPHVFVPLHWIVGNVLAPPNAPANFSLEGRTVIFYKEFGKASISTKTINNAGWFVIDTYSESAIDVNFNDTYFIAVENGADKYGADPVSFKLNPVMGYEVLYPQLQLNSGPKVPTLTGISPSLAEQGKTLDVTIFGINTVNWEKEITKDKVHFTSSDINVNSAKGFGSTILANISIGPAAAEGNFKVTVDGVSGDANFSIVKAGTPSLLGLSPTQGEQGKTVTITLNGSNTGWTEPPVVSFSLPPGILGDNLVEAAHVVVNNPVEISFDAIINTNASAGPRLVTVSGVDSNLSFNVQPAGASSLTKIEPDSGMAGKTLNLKISGSNVNWGNEISADYVYFSSPWITVNAATGEGTFISANISIANSAVKSDCSVFVLGTEGILPFNLLPLPAPAVSGITPASGNAGKTVEITDLAGDNFETGAEVKLTKTDQPDILAADVNVASANKITCSFDLVGATPGSWKIVVTNPDGQSASLADGFEIKEALPPGETPEITTASPLASGTVGTEYIGHQFSAAGGTPPYTWSLDSGTLPPGLDLNESGQISGTPTTAGPNYTFTVKVTDAANASATKEFKLTINAKAVPQGTVKLDIQRSGSDIKVSWDADLYGADAKVYILTSSNPLSGIFSNAYDPASWKAAVNVSDVSFIDPGKLLHGGQAGMGFSEAYYKAVTAGVDLTTASGKDTFANAWAVGKINVDLYGGWNLISAPFVADSLNNVLGTDFKDNEQLWIWSDADSKFKSTATFSNKSWPADLNVSPAQGYWLDLSGTPAKEKKTVTLAGTVYTTTTINKKIYAGWDLIGNPYPKPNPAAEFTPAANDQIWVWDNEGQKFTGTKNYDGTNWGPDALLVPGKGYWYNHIGKGFEWKATN